MGIEKVGITIGKEINALMKTSSGKSLLATKPTNLNNIGLNFTSELKHDSLKLSETSKFIKDLFCNHETS